MLGGVTRDLLHALLPVGVDPHEGDTLGPVFTRQGGHPLVVGVGHGALRRDEHQHHGLPSLEATEVHRLAGGVVQLEGPELLPDRDRSDGGRRGREAHGGDEREAGETHVHLLDSAGAAATCTARSSAARASNRVESSVGRGEFESFMINGISVQPRTTASQPSSFIRPMTR